MGIAIAIVIGATVVLGTGMAGLFDFLGKRAGGGGKELQARLAALEQLIDDGGASDRTGRYLHYGSLHHSRSITCSCMFPCSRDYINNLIRVGVC